MCPDWCAKFLKKRFVVVKSSLTTLVVVTKKKVIMADRPPTMRQFDGSCCANYTITMHNACMFMDVKLPPALSSTSQLKTKEGVGCLTKY
jgi:hypothetical protein